MAESEECVETTLERMKVPEESLVAQLRSQIAHLTRMVVSQRPVATAESRPTSAPGSVHYDYPPLQRPVRPPRHRTSDEGAVLHHVPFRPTSRAPDVAASFHETAATRPSRSHSGGAIPARSASGPLMPRSTGYNVYPYVEQSSGPTPAERAALMRRFAAETTRRLQTIAERRKECADEVINAPTYHTHRIGSVVRTSTAAAAAASRSRNPPRPHRSTAAVEQSSGAPAPAVSQSAQDSKSPPRPSTAGVQVPVVPDEPSATEGEDAEDGASVASSLSDLPIIGGVIPRVRCSQRGRHKRSVTLTIDQWAALSASVHGLSSAVHHLIRGTSPVGSDVAPYYAAAMRSASAPVTVPPSTSPRRGDVDGEEEVDSVGLASRVAYLEAELASVGRTASQLRAANVAAETRIASLEERLDDSNRRAAAAEEQAAASRAELVALDAKRDLIELNTVELTELLEARDSQIEMLQQNLHAQSEDASAMAKLISASNQQSDSEIASMKRYVTTLEASASQAEATATRLLHELAAAEQTKRSLAADIGRAVEEAGASETARREAVAKTQELMAENSKLKGRVMELQQNLSTVHDVAAASRAVEEGATARLRVVQEALFAAEIQRDEALNQLKHSQRDCSGAREALDAERRRCEAISETAQVLTSQMHELQSRCEILAYAVDHREAELSRLESENHSLSSSAHKSLAAARTATRGSKNLQEETLRMLEALDSAVAASRSVSLPHAASYSRTAVHTSHTATTAVHISGANTPKTAASTTPSSLTPASAPPAAVTPPSHHVSGVGTGPRSGASTVQSPVPKMSSPRSFRSAADTRSSTSSLR